MPKTFGNPGNYVLAQASRKFCRFILILILAVAASFYLIGLQHGFFFGKQAHVLAASIIIIAVFTLVFLSRRYIMRHVDQLLAEAIAFRKGAEGEGLTADDLSNLPDTYSVFHDLTHPSIGGNIDHVVVGPTGVFALETKNWKGHVNLSGQGIITVNGEYDHTKDGKAILGRALELNKKIEALSNISTFVQAVMVFPLASVKVDQGTRCKLDVQMLKNLEDYLKRPSSRSLTTQQVTTITRDLNALFKPANL